MEFQVKISTIIGLIALFFLTSSSADNNANTGEFFNSLENFSQNLFREIVKSSDQKSVIYSPFSIQTCLAMTRMGADGLTADEMDHGLGFTGQTPESVADNYFNLLAKYENSNILNIANTIYVKKDNELQDSYKELLSKKFFSSAQSIDFSQKEKAANTINTWVETKTNNAIKDLVQPDSLESDDALLLLSAIHLKGKWATSFPKIRTEEDDFYLGVPMNSESIKVQMMSVSNLFVWYNFFEPKITTVLLPYEDSDLSMLIMQSYVGYEIDLLKADMQKFNFQSLRNITAFAENQKSKIQLKMPKFKTEFEIKLNDNLKTMGLSKMFENADFGKMLKSPQNIYVSDVIHKATIEVTEEGTEAAAVTGVRKTHRVWRPVILNRPFGYAIINKDFIPLFQGIYTGR